MCSPSVEEVPPPVAVSQQKKNRRHIILPHVETGTLPLLGGKSHDSSLNGHKGKDNMFFSGRLPPPCEYPTKGDMEGYMNEPAKSLVVEDTISLS